MHLDARFAPVAHRDLGRNRINLRAREASRPSEAEGRGGRAVTKMGDGGSERSVPVIVIFPSSPFFSMKLTLCPVPLIEIAKHHPPRLIVSRARFKNGRGMCAKKMPPKLVTPVNYKRLHSFSTAQSSSH